MKPILSGSLPCAHDGSASANGDAARVASAVLRLIDGMESSLGTGRNRARLYAPSTPALFSCTGKGAKRERVTDYSGWYGLPSEAGAFRRIIVASRDISASTTTVATYGSIASSCDGTATPAACVTLPNRYAPIITRHGFHDANTTSASAIQPRPAVIPSTHDGV